MIRILILTICLTFSLVPLGHAQEKLFPDIETAILDNGLQVVFIPNTRAPVVMHSIWYKVGAADEELGKSGLAHFYEHLMFKGTKTLAPGEFSKIIRKLGGQDNAFTSQDYTGYFQIVAKQHLETVMKMEADRMVNLSLPEKDVMSERDVILEERSQTLENRPYRQFYSQISNKLYINHPYAKPVIGWRDEIAGLSHQDVLEFYEQWYDPANAIVVISGDTDFETVMALARQYYGPIHGSGRDDTRNRPKAQSESGHIYLHSYNEKAEQPIFVRAYRMPSYRQDYKAGLALTVLNDILARGTSSRLYKSIVVDQKLATAINFSYNGRSHDDGEAWLNATPADGISLETVEQAVNVELQTLLEHGVTTEEVQTSITRIMNDSTFERDSLRGPANTIGSALIVGLTIDDIQSWPERISQITADDINNAARTWLAPDTPLGPIVTGYLRKQRDDTGGGQ